MSENSKVRSKPEAVPKKKEIKKITVEGTDVNAIPSSRLSDVRKKSKSDGGLGAEDLESRAFATAEEKMADSEKKVQGYQKILDEIKALEPTIIEKRREAQEEMRKNFTWFSNLFSFSPEKRLIGLCDKIHAYKTDPDLLRYNALKHKLHDPKPLFDFFVDQAKSGLLFAKHASRKFALYARTIDVQKNWKRLREEAENMDYVGITSSDFYNVWSLFGKLSHTNPIAVTRVRKYNKELDTQLIKLMDEAYMRVDNDFMRD